MNYEVTETSPITEDDRDESEFFRNLAIKAGAFQVPQRLASRNRILFWGSLKKRQLTQRVSALLPHGSKRRHYASELVKKSPKFLRNHLTASMTPTIHSTKNVHLYSLDLGFGLPTSSIPRISIVIPVYNHWWVTYRCLRAIQRMNTQQAFEVLVVDDSSTDQTSQVLRNIRGIRAVRNNENLGYLESTNIGASLAAESSEYIVLLNNDTEPIGNWLDELLLVFEENPEAAIVGSTLFYPDGSVQESGSQIFKSANGWNIGRNHPELDAKFLSLREVDYCSAASIMVEKTFWRKVGGFDPLFKPAYYEDTDLAMSAWSLGKKVFISPNSWVIHHEGVSHGKSLENGIKKYQVVNREKFKLKWQSELNDHWTDEGYPRVEHARNSKGIVVLCDRQLPDTSRDSGSQRTVRIAEILTGMGYHVILTSIDTSSRQIQIEKLRKFGIEVQTSISSLIEALEYRSSRIVLFWTIREEVYEYFENALKGINHKVPFISDLLDLKYSDTKEQKVAPNQIEISRKTAMTILVSPLEAKNLQKFTQADVRDLWYDFSLMGVEYNPAERVGLIFVGGFRHRPNVEGIFWFAQSVLPILRDLGFIEHIEIIGSGLSETEIKQLTELGLTILGYQPNISARYARSRIAIVPLISGAGLKGKLAEALSYGIPTITTSVGAEGFPSFDSTQPPFIVCDSPFDFANSIYNLTRLEQMSISLSLNARKYMNKNFSSEVLEKKISGIMNSIAINNSANKESHR